MLAARSNHAVASVSRIIRTTGTRKTGPALRVPAGAARCGHTNARSQLRRAALPAAARRTRPGALSPAVGTSRHGKYIATLAAVAGAAGVVALAEDEARGLFANVGKAPPVKLLQLQDLDDRREALNSIEIKQAMLDELQLLVEMHPNESSVHWRLARAYFDVANDDANKKNTKVKSELLEKALEIVKQARELNPRDGDAARWNGTILQGAAEMRGNKAYIASLYEVKELWELAVDINPADASAHHLLGRWAHGIANLGWASRNVAKLLFGTPPTASFAEALTHFERAESISPGFWKMNLVMLADCEQKLGNRARAHELASRALAMESRTQEDEEAHAKAAALANKTKP